MPARRSGGCRWPRSTGTCWTATSPTPTTPPATPATPRRRCSWSRSPVTCRGRTWTSPGRPALLRTTPRSSRAAPASARARCCGGSRPARRSIRRRRSWSADDGIGCGPARREDAMTEETGVVFPAGPDGRRSTAALGRAVVADALRPVDPAGALAAEQETNWRAGYLAHFRRLVEAGLTSAEAARSIAAAGLGSLHERMRVALPDGEVALDRWTKPSRSLDTVEVQGTGEREEEFSLPYGGTRLRGDDLRRPL